MFYKILTYVASAAIVAPFVVAVAKVVGVV